jgi:1-acyl-sn-glycerol-3-phosphate acyltransferase
MRVLQFWFKAASVAGLFIYGLLAVAAIMPLLSRLAGGRAESLCDRVRMGWYRALCRVLRVRVERVGTPDANARLLVVNHVSWLDILALGTQRPVVFVAKREVAEWPVVGYLAQRTGTLFVQRGDVDRNGAVVERMTWCLRQGKPVVLFPEGTTTTGERVLRFHARLFQPARLAHVPTQAIAIEYAGPARAIAPFVGDDSFLPHLLRVLMLDHIEIRLHFCPSLPAGTPRDTLAQATRGQVIEALFGNRAANTRTA